MFGATDAHLLTACEYEKCNRFSVCLTLSELSIPYNYNYLSSDTGNGFVQCFTVFVNLN